MTAQIVAKDLGVRLDSFAFELSADLDTAALVGGSHDADANFERITVDATIGTSATPDQFAQLKAETERRCPIYQLFSRSGVTLVTNWRAV